jgi:hypothetical protein
MLAAATSDEHQAVSDAIRQAVGAITAEEEHGRGDG